MAISQRRNEENIVVTGCQLASFRHDAVSLCDWHCPAVVFVTLSVTVRLIVGGTSGCWTFPRVDISHTSDIPPPRCISLDNAEKTMSKGQRLKWNCARKSIRKKTLVHYFIFCHQPLHCGMDLALTLSVLSLITSRVCMQCLWFDRAMHVQIAVLQP